ncbi:MAG TPA: four helix bundle protein, partial [Gemmatimonadaceae bacterium]|nr:four helix bundle protein [Gemmatimonadaceae bacterium]
MTYEEWERTVPVEMKGEPAWRVQAFRLASFLSECADWDTDDAVGDPRYVEPAAQLCSAAGSIAANLSEGYARLSSGDRIRFYEYALGSAAES